MRVILAALLTLGCVSAAQAQGSLGGGSLNGIPGGGSSSSSAALGVVTPEQYGAVGDAQTKFDGAFTAAASQASATNTSATPTAPTITTTTANDVVVSVFAPVSTFTANPTGTLRANLPAAGGNYGAVAVDNAVTTPGATSPISGTAAGSALWMSGSIALAPSPGQSISFIASTTSTSASTSTTILTKPTGTVAGDYLLGCLPYYDKENPVFGFPNGWHRIFALGTQDRFACYGHVAGASEPTTYSFYRYTPQFPSGSVGMLLTYRGTSGVDGASNILNSATANFLPTAVGSLLCVQQTAGDTNGYNQNCGTITGYLSATQVTTSIPLMTSVSAREFSFGHDDWAKFNTMITTAPCSTVGCKITLGTKHYALSDGLPPFVPNIPITLVGNGAGVANTANNFLNGNTLTNRFVGSMLQYLTLGMTRAAITIGGTLHLTNTTGMAEVSNVTLMGGAGLGSDGGSGLPIDGLDILNYQGSVINHVLVFNFSGLGSKIDGMAAANYQDYSENNLIDNSYLSFNGQGGLSEGSSLNVYNIETTQIEHSVIEANGGPGIILAGANLQGGNIAGNTIQWNNRISAGTEISVPGITVGYAAEGNYFEADTLVGSQSTAAWPNTVGMIGIRRGSNYYTPANIVSPLVFAAAGTALPTCSATNQTIANLSATVTDSAACTIGTTYASGGTTRCRVTCSGGVWKETGAASYE